MLSNSIIQCSPVNGRVHAYGVEPGKLVPVPVPGLGNGQRILHQPQKIIQTTSSMPTYKTARHRCFASRDRRQVATCISPLPINRPMPGRPHASWGKLIRPICNEHPHVADDFPWHLGGVFFTECGEWKFGNRWKLQKYVYTGE